MSDALPLPPRPSLEQFTQLAKGIQHACKSRDHGAIRGLIARHLESTARVQGVETAPKVPGTIQREAERLEHRWRELTKTDDRAARCLLAAAQLFVARAHGFAGWPEFAAHVGAVARAGSPGACFEAAADAIVSGDTAALGKLLHDHPGLVRARSAREHRSTLLHYVSANGVEDFRQKTPENIVEITKLLLDAGADVNAESDAYGGRSTTLGLTATSWHPADAGVQLPLMDLLIASGAVIDGPDGGSAVNGCLHNGRGEAAEFLASRGARLDLEGAAGVGRLDVVRSFFNEDGSLVPPATAQQAKDGFAWACQFGRTGVVEFLLDSGVAIDARLKHDGQTGLHWAAYGGHAETIEALLRRGAPVDAKDESYGGTALAWALYVWGNATGRELGRGRYYDAVALLVGAGARLDPEWYSDDDEERRRALAKVRGDPRMIAALGAGNAPGTSGGV